MGTNYYTRIGHEETHLGKLSAGWKFSFKAEPDWSRTEALELWIARVTGAEGIGGCIEDEYGTLMRAEELIAMAVSQKGHCHLQYVPDLFGASYEFWKHHKDKYDYHCGGFDFSTAEYT